MRQFSFAILAFCLAAVVYGFPNGSKKYRLRPFHINLSKDVPRMLEKVRRTQMPNGAEYADIGSSAGIDLDVLKELRTEWLTKFDWEKEQASLNK